MKSHMNENSEGLNLKRDVILSIFIPHPQIWLGRLCTFAQK